MNTVGKPGKLGEQVKCVVSVSMLTEGWDANTVTHILGVRAFGTQLLCEQVVGRGLRRMSYAANDEGMLRAGVRRGLRRAVLVHPQLRLNHRPQARPDAHARARLEDRIACEITFPRLVRLPLRTGRGAAEGRNFGPKRTWRFRRGTADDDRDAPHHRRDRACTRCTGCASGASKRSTSAWRSLVLEKYFRDDDGNAKPWLFPQLLALHGAGCRSA
jgi:type III restriction enzyme